MGRQNPGRVEKKVTSGVLKRRRSTGRDAQGAEKSPSQQFFRPFGAKSFSHSTHGSPWALILRRFAAVFDLGLPQRSTAAPPKIRIDQEQSFSVGY
jgi:hypothetical protein